MTVSYVDKPAGAEREAPSPRRVVRLSATDGTELWSQPDPRNLGYLLPPVVADGVAVYPGHRASFGVDAATGVQRWRRETPQLEGWNAEVMLVRGNKVYLLLLDITEKQVRDGYRYPQSGAVRLAAISATDGTVDLSPKIALNPDPPLNVDCGLWVGCSGFASPYLGIGPGVLVTTADNPDGSIDVVGVG